MKAYILFVCGHNSGRSQMAEVYFNTYRPHRWIEARSAGTALKWDGLINPRVVKLLLEKGIDISRQDRIYMPKVLTDELLAGSERIYTMGCMDGCVLPGYTIDGDFGLADPAKAESDLEEIWSQLEIKMKPILESFTGDTVLQKLEIWDTLTENIAKYL